MPVSIVNKRFDFPKIEAGNGNLSFTTLSLVLSLGYFLVSLTFFFLSFVSFSLFSNRKLLIISYPFTDQQSDHVQRTRIPHCENRELLIFS